MCENMYRDYVGIDIIDQGMFLWGTISVEELNLQIRNGSYF